MTRRNMGTLGALGVLFVLIAVVIGAFVPDDGKAEVTSASADSTNRVSDALKDALTITSVTLSCPESVLGHGGSTMASGTRTVVIFKDHIGALKGTPPRKWSDALSTPYIKTEPQEMLGETQATACMDPLYGVTLANFFANMSVGDVKLVDLNPWLTPFAGDAGQINDKAAEFIPLLDVTKNITDEQAGKAITQNIAWQRVAEKIGTLLTRFEVDGIRAEQSVLNYHLSGGGASVGGLPEVGLNPNQENLPALMLKLTEKGACVPIKVIGFNTGDKRPEEFTPPVCAKPVPQPEQPAPKPKPKPTPTTVPKPKPTPTTTPATVPKTTPTTTPAPTTTAPPRTGKETPPNTVAPPPTTTAPPTTAPPNNGGQGDSGDGATNTTSPPTTQAPAPAPPVTSSPTTNPPPPPG